jgi:hypothetical protein
MRKFFSFPTVRQIFDFIVVVIMGIVVWWFGVWDVVRRYFNGS